MKKQWIVIFLMLFMTTVSLAQTEIAKKPRKYLNPRESDTIPKGLATDLSDRPWYVLSDRSSNPVYNDVGQEISKLDFGVKLAVINTSSDDSRLYVAFAKDIVGRELHKDKKPIGWVDSDKLLLWEKCLVDNVYGVDKKAMILFTINAARNQTIDGNTFTSDVFIFKSPVSNTDTIGTHKGIFQFFPIYKANGRFVLLGEGLTLDGQKEYNGLKGWVDTNNVSQWSHRIALEKNWKNEAIAERKRNTDNIGLMVLKTHREAELYAETDRKVAFTPFVTNQSPYQETRFDATRQPGPMGRFPILDIKQITNNVGTQVSNPVKVGVISDVMVGNSSWDLSNIYKLSQDALDLKNVNVIFVIDATESMEEYRKSVIKGVNDALRSIKKLYESQGSSQEDQNKFRFGCLLYRDYNMLHTTQTFGSTLELDTTAFFTWLRKNMVMEMNARRPGLTKDIGQDDDEEAMYYGIQTAMYDYNPDPKKSNYMILIGDCGDHQEDKDPTGELQLLIEEDSLVADLKYYNMNLLAFQVHHNNESAYDLFQEQIKRIIKKTGNSNLVPNAKKSNLFELPEGVDYSGKILTCKKGNIVAVNEMSNLINESIKQINKDVNGKIKNIIKGLKGLGQDIDPWATAKVLKFLIESGVTENQARKILAEGMNQEYEVGYTVLKCMGYNYPNYQQVILFERTELERVVNVFRDLAAAIDYPASDQRDRLVTALETWFPTYFSGVQDSILKDLKVGELLNKITGLDFGDKYNTITITKITNPILVSDAKMTEFLIAVSGSLKELENIYNNQRAYPARIEIVGDNKTLYVYVPGDVFLTNN